MTKRPSHPTRKLAGTAPPEWSPVDDLLTPAELEALRRDGEEARKFAIAWFGLEDDDGSTPSR